MEANRPATTRVPAAANLLGYLNFSDGRPDGRFQRQLNDAFVLLPTWPALGAALLADLADLHAAGSAAFRDCTQAQAVVPLVCDRALAAYRAHHADLLAHQPEASLFTPFFVARVAEALLSQGGPWNETERILAGTLRKLNDFVGHRPVAMLETRVRTEVYAHERVRPIPVYLRGVGVSAGPYAAVIELTLNILQQVPNDLGHEAGFDLNLLDELAIDPRAYDHAHPANRRPNYLFGEWDPHHLDNQGRYRRFVLRQATLDALMERVGTPAEADKLYEGAAVLAGTILMAAGVSGAGPGMHDSTVTLGKLVPKIARYRDQFYTKLLDRLGGAHREHLHKEMQQTRQPFGGARQHLNQALARQRATQLQERRLALVFAEMGFPTASRRRAARIPTASARLMSETRIRQTAARLALERDQLADAGTLLSEAEDWLLRGIYCGALPDPWNILGFQGLFPLFNAREDSVRDTRLDDLLETVSRQLHLYALGLAASARQKAGAFPWLKRMQHFAEWWDQYATADVSDLPRVHGGERTSAAEHVAQALARWQQRGTTKATDDLTFWRQHRDGFQSPAAFAQVIEALLRGNDRRAALALLMTWLSLVDTVPLEEGEASFAALAERWVRATVAAEGSAAGPTLTKFIELLEANADDWWLVPAIGGALPPKDEDDEDPFGAAYEGMLYKDSTDDGNDSAMLGSEQPRDLFALEDDAPRIEKRLRFLGTVAKLWQMSAHALKDSDPPEALAGWVDAAARFDVALQNFTEALHAFPVPDPSGHYEAMVEYERRRGIKEQLTDLALHTGVEMRRATWALLVLDAGGNVPTRADLGLLPWEESAIRLVRYLGTGDPAQLRRQLGTLAANLRQEPLLFVPLSEGGAPAGIRAARLAQALVQQLLELLPTRGLLRETYHLLKLARTMEQNAPAEGRKVTEFDRLFRIGLQAVLESVVASASAWPASVSAPIPLVDLLRKVVDPFLSLWIAHSQTLRLSVLESVGGPGEWEQLREFIRKYGGDLFTSSFLALANLRGILHRGVGAWLTALIEEPDPVQSLKLLDAIERGKYPREKAIAQLEYTLPALAENYEEYRDFNTTTTQSDYGDNLHQLLDFLHIKAKYDRYAWRMRPLLLAHEVLCRAGRIDAALRWQDNLADFTRRLADNLLDELATLEREQGMKLRTVRDRIEERFIHPLAADQLCAAVEPALRAAEHGEGESSAAFARLETLLSRLAETPVGVGLDVPLWLRRLEGEVQRIRERQTAAPVPGPVRLSYPDLQQQLADWEKPLG